MAYVSTWSLTVYDYGIWLCPSRVGRDVYCNQTPFPLREGGVWARDYALTCILYQCR